MIKLCIQNGHRNAANGQTGTSGTTSGGQKLNEVDFIDQVYYAIKKVIDSTPEFSSKIQLSYDDAVVRNGATADYFIAIHADGATDPNYNGGFVDDCPACPNNGVQPCDNSSTPSWAFAQTVADYYFNPVGIRFAPEHRTSNSTYYYAFNSTGANTKQFILECGAMTNKPNMDKLINTTNVGKLILNGIIAYFRKVEALFQNPTPPTPPPQPPTDPCANVKQQLTVATQGLAKAQADLQALQTQMTTALAVKDQECLQKLALQKQKVINLANSL